MTGRLVGRGQVPGVTSTWDDATHQKCNLVDKLKQGELKVICAGVVF